MAVLFPSLPFAADETSVSWACRLAALHTGSSMSRFLEDLEVNPYSLIDGDPAAHRVLAERAGEDPERVLANAIAARPGKMVHIRGHDLSADFVLRSTIRVCPACLQEDLRDREALPKTLWRGRLVWTFRVVRICPIHQRPILTVGKPRAKAFWLDVGHGLCGKSLERLAAAPYVAAEPSDLQTWTVNRLEGGDGGGWLCSQAVGQAVRACEMLGVLFEFGPTPNLKAFSDEDWDRAGRAGYAVAAGGEDAIRDALLAVQRKHSKGHAGPQAKFGRLYQWLEFNKSGRDRGPIKDLLRRHIIETMPVGEGDLVLGAPVERRKIHSVYTLVQQTGLHAKRLRKAVIALGVAPDATLDQDPNAIVFDAVEGERLAAVLKDSVPQSALPAELNCSRNHAKVLFEAGILVPVIGVDRNHRLREKAFDRADLTSLLAALADGAERVAETSDGFYDLSGTSSRAMTDTATLIRLILGRRLQRRQWIESHAGLSAIRLDPEEVRDILEPDRAARDVGIARAAKLLNTTGRVVKALIEDGHGEPFLPTRAPGPGSPACKRVGISLSDIAAFRERYVSLSALSVETGLHFTVVKRILKAHAVEPVGDPERLHARFYRRAELPEIGQAM